MKLLGESFPVVKAKGKRTIVRLDWGKLRGRHAAMRDAKVDHLRQMRGVVVHDGKEFLHGVRIAAILKVLPHIDPRKSVRDRWPRKQFHVTPNDIARLVGQLDLLPRLGAIMSLSSDDGGAFWFSVRPRFPEAVSESLASLDRLADLAEGVPAEAQRALSETYRRLSTLTE